ncbi:MAG: hypothetical protein C7B44_05700 [Sulfobacillus thermosulfidooxidans]|uniref:Uncharacterized protein n=1 Tax=Sulfobacillus acidophilus TaxID=53633 RepID=A0A2T2WCC5_9FIRM|nr:MAG: hypothetical protein C7B45_17690 [Sulfobacillus acidophilus]PSR37058.1 MAG: hypothetical protein C7B44_05700 [Sulfobacillus thermosulfidooxidans]
MAPPVERKSSYNTIMQFLLATLGGLITSTESAVFGSSSFGIFLSGSLSTLASNAGVSFFNRFFSRSSSTVDQAYQTAWIWPNPYGTSGYLILQPHHYRHLHQGRDRIDFHQTPRILGYTDTLDQAQVVCERITHDQGLVQHLAVDTNSPDLRWGLFHKAWNEYQRHAKKIRRETDELLTGIWHYAQVDATHSEMVAYRNKMTAHGWQWEFFPLPPQTAPTPAVLRHQMDAKHQWNANDLLLPEKMTDGHALTDSSDLATAWRFQALTHESQHTIPWQFLNVAEPGTPPRWALGCATPGPHATDPPVWHFWPESGPLVAWPDLDTARQAVYRVAAPNTDTRLWPVNSHPDTAIMTTWRHAVGLADPPNIPTAAATLSVMRRATVSSS